MPLYTISLRWNLYFIGGSVPIYLQNRNWLLDIGREGKAPRTPLLTINNILGPSGYADLLCSQTVVAGL